jgi:hypothetical protein
MQKMKSECNCGPLGLHKFSEIKLKMNNTVQLILNILTTSVLNEASRHEGPWEVEG